MYSWAGSASRPAHRALFFLSNLTDTSQADNFKMLAQFLHYIIFLSLSLIYKLQIYECKYIFQIITNCNQALQVFVLNWIDLYNKNVVVF